MIKHFCLLPRVALLALLLPACAHTTTTQPETTTKIWKIAVVSDMNQSYGSKLYTPALKAAIAHIQQSGVSLVLSTGDMVAGQKRGLDYLGMWNSFHNHVSRPLAQQNITFLPSPGNHDASIGSGFKTERKYYVETWNEFPIGRFNNAHPVDEQVQFLPGVTQNFPLNYAVTMGPALFVALDATSGDLTNGQLEWLEEVLKNSESYTVKMIFGHFPMLPYTFDRAHDYLGRNEPLVTARLEAMLEQYQVDYFLSGHHHGYFPGKRLGNVRYVSVPLLGTGARYLLTEGRSEKNRSPQSFLYFQFDASGNISMNALKSPSMEEITSDMLPDSISIPKRDASDCRGCANFPSMMFIDQTRRILYHRL